LVERQGREAIADEWQLGSNAAAEYERRCQGILEQFHRDLQRTPSNGGFNLGDRASARDYVFDARVGRWMGREELEAMQDTGRSVESTSGTTHIANPSNPESYRRQAANGSSYVEFDIPDGSLTKPDVQGWLSIIGPNSLRGRIAARRGQPINQMPEATNIEYAHAMRNECVINT
jgi:hypothetical protein